MSLVTQIRLTFPSINQTPDVLAKTLRGAICSLQPNSPLLSQHDGEGHLYRYPKVQYRWLDNHGYIIGFGLEASRLITSLVYPGLVLQLEDFTLPIIGTDVTSRPIDIQESKRLIRYPFLSPWVPLGKENLQKYLQSSNDARIAMLDEIATNQLVQIFKDLGTTPNFFIQACVHTIGNRFLVRYKEGETHSGFWGHLICNVKLPPFFAVGQKVSHGYGWLRIARRDCKEFSA